MRMRNKPWSICVYMTASAIVLAVGCGEDGMTTPGYGTGGSSGMAGAGTAATGSGGSTGGSNASVDTGGSSGAAGVSGAGAGAGGSGGTTVDAGNAGSGGAVDAGAVDGGGPEPMRLAISMNAVPTGGEDHVCVTLALPNDEVMWVESIRATLTDGSHHLIVDREPVGTALSNTPTTCPPTNGGDSTRLIIAQQHDTVLDLPEGTAMRIEPRQPVFLQLHYINSSEATADIEGTVELRMFDDSAGAPNEVHSVFTGPMNIQLLSGQTDLVEHFFEPPGTSSRPLNVFAITSHTHSLGTEATIERVDGLSAADVEPLHRNLDWAEPPLTQFDPPLIFDGSDGLRLRCHYTNDTDHTVTFGVRFEDEMCFLWLYYFEEP